MNNRTYRKSRNYVDYTAIVASVAIILSTIAIIVTLKVAPKDEPKEEPAPTQQTTYVEEVTEPETEPPTEPQTEPVTEPATEPATEPEAADKWGMTAEELEVVKRVVTAESMGECYLGQMAVAQCIRETAEVTGKTPYEVVMEPKQYAAPANMVTDSVSDAVQAVLYDGEDAVSEDIRYFYAPGRVYSEWHETKLEFVCEIGGHRFFKTK